MAGELLQIGQIVQTVFSKQPCRVDKFLGGGGQGEVYQANLVGSQMALKWYFVHQATEQQWTALLKLIESGPPSERFLWPVELVVAEGIPGFGYLMRLRLPRFRGILDLMTNRIDPTFRALTTSGLQLSESFFQLHAEGLCYRDISFGNAFFDPNNGETLVCDNDNVSPNLSEGGAILGTPDFMAPEIVRGEERPNRQTDLYSLAVLLFYMFHVQHPLYGKRLLNIKILDLKARTVLCGTKPLFIFDPDDNSNEAVNDPEAGANALRYWPIYPRFFQKAFMDSFTKGLHDQQHGRVREGEWRKIISRLRDSIFYCFHCSPIGTENFFDHEAFKASGGNLPHCRQCKNEVKLPYRLRLNNEVIMLTHQTKLFPHHINKTKDFDFSEPVAEIVQDPQHPERWGLKNLTSERWVVIREDGTMKDVDPGRSAVLTKNSKINFGGIEGEIRY